MRETRQDAWTREEDHLLAETVLQYIKNGNTQLEAFKDVASKLARTPAACGFRWNATIRKQYEAAIEYAKDERKKVNSQALRALVADNEDEKDTLESVIKLLEKMKMKLPEEESNVKQEQGETIERLRKENQQLLQQVERYNNAWNEMGRLWGWVHTISEKEPE